MTEKEKVDAEERRSLCPWNLPRHSGNGCKVPLEKCFECKAFETMPLGLESIITKGWKGILEKQQGLKNDRK